MAESVDYLNPLFIREEESRSGAAGAVVDLGTFSYFWDGTGHVWLSSRPDGHDPITFFRRYTNIDVDGPLGRATFNPGGAAGGVWCCLSGLLYEPNILEVGWNELSFQARNNVNVAGEFGTSAINVITLPYPEPGFTAFPLSGPAPLTVQLTDATLYMDSAVCGRYSSSKYLIYRNKTGSLEWRYELNPTIVLESPGRYGAKRVVSNNNGGHRVFDSGYIIHVLPGGRERRRAAAWMNMERPLF